MAVYKDKRPQKEAEEVEEVEEAPEAFDTSGIDALLDEIDDVLEENAEEFVKQYVQKGGE